MERGGRIEPHHLAMIAASLFSSSTASHQDRERDGGTTAHIASGERDELPRSDAILAAASEVDHTRAAVLVLSAPAPPRQRTLTSHL